MSMFVVHSCLEESMDHFLCQDNSSDVNDITQ